MAGQSNAVMQVRTYPDMNTQKPALMFALAAMLVTAMHTTHTVRNVFNFVHHHISTSFRP